MRTKGLIGLAVTACAATISFTAGCGSKSPGTTTGQAGASGATGGSGAAGAGSGAAGTGSGAAGTGSGAAGTGNDAGAGSSGASGGGGGTGVAGQGGAPHDGGTDAALSAGPCSPPAAVDKPPAKLSQTGCMDPSDIKKMAALVVPYEVNSPLWSDNADKARGFVLPAGKKIHVKDCASTPAECPHGTQDNGKWVMPVGTVMVKSFSVDGKLIETRLLVHQDAATWNGYSYQWNEAQTEATVVPADDDPSLNNKRFNEPAFNTGSHVVNWTFPYRFDCNACHTVEAGGTLGPETRQMNRIVGAANQLDTWKAMSLFETAPKTPYQAALVLPYSGQLGTVTPNPTAMEKEQRARSYLHANCAYCHRPDSATVNWLDFRFDTTLKNTGGCGVAPMKGTVGVDGALIVKPGKPMESTMWLRMHAPYTGDKTRMPQLATYVVDDKGLAVIGDWITSLTACP